MRRALRLTAGFAALGVLTHVVLPGLAFHVALKAFRTLPPYSLWRWADFLSGGGVQRASVAALGFLPYLTARVVLAVATRVVPAARRLRDTSAGEQRLRRWRWRLTAAIGAANALGFAARLLDIPGAVTIPAPLFVASTVALLTGTSLAAMALVETAHAMLLGVARGEAAQRPVPRGAFALRDGPASSVPGSRGRTGAPHGSPGPHGDVGRHDAVPRAQWSGRDVAAAHASDVRDHRLDGPGERR